MLEKLAAKQKRPVPRDLVSEFLWRSGVSGVIKHYDRLSVRERFQAFQLDRARFLVPKLREADRYLFELAGQALSGEISDEEMIQVVEVQLS